MNKHDLRVIKTKQILKKALLQQLETTPLEKMKIAELCREASVSRGTFYLHYETIGDLFEEYYADIMEDMRKSYLEPLKKAKLVESNEIEPAMIRIFHHIKKYERFYRICFSNKIPMAYYYMLFEQISALLKTDLVSFDQDGIDVGYTTAFHANAIIGIIIEWYKRDFRDSAEQVSEQLVKIVNLRYKESNMESIKVDL